MWKYIQILLGAAAAAVLATAVNAADEVVYDQPPEAVVVEPGFTWTGLYVGGNAGYSWGDFDHSLDIAPIDLITAEFPGVSDTFGEHADGISGGAQAGYNWQVNNFVFGVEADIQAANVPGSASRTETVSLPFPIGDISVTTAARTDVDWFGTARARAGFSPQERLMVYGTGGFAFGRTSSTISVSVSEPPPVGDLNGETSSSRTRTGWAAGGGIEFAIDGNWSVKGEYLFTDLGDEKVFSVAEDPAFANLSSEVQFHTVRIGVNYGF